MNLPMNDAETPPRSSKPKKGASQPLWQVRFLRFAEGNERTRPDTDGQPTPQNLPKTSRTTAPEIRFARFLSPEPTTGCHLFTGCTQSRGYGSFGISPGRSVLAHRYAWELEHGPIADGLTVDHRCLQLTCCNVRHLQLVTGAVNSSLASSRLTHCARGHARGPGVTFIRADGRIRCIPCRRIEERLRWGDRDEAAAVADAKRDWPGLFAAAEKRIAGIVNKRARLTEVAP